MNKLLAAFGCVSILLSFAAGCYSGDPIAHSTVTLTFPEGDKQTNASLSTLNPEVKEALRIIDDVLVSTGFTRDEKPPTAQEQAQGIIATYGRYTVCVENRDLVVNFVEFGKRRSSPIVINTCKSLKERLDNRFGTKRVFVEGNTEWMQVK